MKTNKSLWITLLLGLLLSVSNMPTAAAQEAGVIVLPLRNEGAEEESFAPFLCKGERRHYE